MRFPKIPYWPFLLGPALSFALGFSMNALVMAANHGQMPVLVPGGHCGLIDPDDFIHSCMTSATHFKILADWIVINHFGVASPGDFFEWFAEQTFVPSLAIWIALVIKDKHKEY